MKRKPYFLKVALSAALLGASLMYTGCEFDDDDTQPNDQEQQNPGNNDSKPNDQEQQNPGGDDSKPNNQEQQNPGGDDETPGGTETPEIQYIQTACLAKYFETCPDEVTVYLDLQDFDHTEVMLALQTTEKKVTLVIPEGVEALVIESIKLPVEKDETVDPENVSLVKVVIPSTVNDIGYLAFGRCYALETVEIKSSSIDRIGAWAFVGCNSLVKFEIPSSVTEIDAYAFEGCTSLEGIVIPETVTSIGSNAFYGCESLSSIKIPGGVQSIETSAFQRCVSLESIEISDGVVSIDEYAIAGCVNLTSIVIPASVSELRHWAFIGCESLTSIDISGVTSLGEDVFFNCPSLETIYVNQGIYDKYHDTWPQMVVKAE